METKEDLEKEIKIKLLLIKDFEELDRGELQTLRNYTRHVYKIDGVEKVGEETLLNAYLIFKRKMMEKLDTVLVCPYPMISGGGNFAAEATTYAPVPINTFRGLNGDRGGTFLVKGWQSMPVLTVFYFDDHTEVICLSPDGDFCRITSKTLQFDI